MVTVVSTNYTNITMIFSWIINNGIEFSDQLDLWMLLCFDHMSFNKAGNIQKLCWLDIGNFLLPSQNIFLIPCWYLLKGISQRWKIANFLFWARIFMFQDWNVVKTERSKVLAVKIEENEKSLEEKRIGCEFFYRRCNRFLAPKMNFLCWLNIMTPTKSLK